MSLLGLDNFFEAAREAEDDGYKVLVSKNHQLFLDLDNAESIRKCDAGLHFLSGYYDIKKVYAWRSKSENLHKVIELRIGLTVPERIAMQMFLGSDPTKEILSLLRHRQGVDEPIRLFVPPNTLPKELDDESKIGVVNLF